MLLDSKYRFCFYSDMYSWKLTFFEILVFSYIAFLIFEFDFCICYFSFSFKSYLFEFLSFDFSWYTGLTRRFLHVIFLCYFGEQTILLFTFSGILSNYRKIWFSRFLHDLTMAKMCAYLIVIPKTSLFPWFLLFSTFWPPSSILRFQLFHFQFMIWYFQISIPKLSETAPDHFHHQNHQGIIAPGPHPHPPFPCLFLIVFEVFLDICLFRKDDFCYYRNFQNIIVLILTLFKF